MRLDSVCLKKSVELLTIVNYIEGMREFAVSGSLRKKIWVAGGALIACWVGVGSIVVLQSGPLQIKLHNMVGTTTSETFERDANPLNGVALEVLAFLQDQDASHFKRVEENGQRLGAFVKGYVQVAGRDAGSLEKNYQVLRTSTLQLLQTVSAQNQARVSLRENRRSIEQIFAEKIIPSIRPSQLGGFARLRSALSARAAAGVLAERVGDSLSTPEDRTEGEITGLAKTFRQEAQAYRETARRRSEVKAIDQVQALFNQSVVASRQIVELQRIKASSLQQFTQAHRDMEVVLAQADPSLIHRGLSLSQQAVARKAYEFPAALGALLLIGVGTTLVFLHRLVRHVVDPLKEWTRVTHAAATGDLTQTARSRKSLEVGALSESINRLIRVLARSQNLVYHLASLVELSGEAIISQDLDGRILSWNKSAQRLYGYAAEEVQGRSISILASAGQADEFPSILERVRRGERVPPYESVHIGRSGRLIRVWVRVAAIRDSTKDIIGVSLCAHESSDLDPRLLKGAWQKNPVPFMADSE
jgi:PAS domain S-box-containing protein